MVMFRLAPIGFLSVALLTVGCSRALPPAKTPTALKDELKSSDKVVRLAAVTEVKNMGPGAVDLTTDLLDVLKDQDPELRQAAAEALAQIGPEAGPQTLEKVEAAAGTEKNAMVQSALAEAVKALRPEHVKGMPKHAGR
jgi:HEAT repeat protein